MDDDETGGAVDTGTETNALGGAVTPTPTENPAWSSYVDKFPDPVKHIAREAFSEWDKGVQTRFTNVQEKYRPYQQFVDQGVAPEKLEAAYGVAQMLENDPPGFARLLAQQLGLTIQEAEAVAEELSGDEGGDDENVDPRLKAIEEQNARLMEMFETQQTERQQAEESARQTQQIESEMGALEAKYGKMIPAVKDQVLREALRLSYETNEPVTMEQAYNSLEGFVQQVRNVPRPGQLAPRVLAGGNSVPLTPQGKSPGKMTSAETKNVVAEILAREAAAG